MSVSNITEKRMSRFSWNVQCRSDMRWKQSGTFWGCCIEPFGSGSIFLLCGFVLDGNIMEKRFDGFSWNFQHMLDNSQQNNLLGCFTPNYTLSRPPPPLPNPPPTHPATHTLGVASCLLATQWKKNDEWIFMKHIVYGGYHTRINLEHFGDVEFNLLWSLLLKK